MRRLALALSLMLPACGGGGGSSSPSTPSSPAATRASIGISQNNTGQICFSPIRTIRVLLPMRVVETAGVGANYNFVRLSLMLGTREIERSEMTATDLRNMNASRITPTGTLLVTFTHDFNAGPNEFDSLVYLSGFTDDRGNTIEVRQGPPFSVVSTVVCSI